jgi:hypothetical protein
MQRPQPVLRLSQVLCLIGLSALGGLAIAPWGRPLPVAPQLLAADPIIAGWSILIAAACYCAATLAAAFALWRMASWVRWAYAAFVVTLLTYVAVFLYLVRIRTPPALSLIFFVFLSGGVYWGWRIVDRSFPVQARTP